MADHPPFMNGYNVIGRVFDRIQSAQTPPRFTQDFLASKLGVKGGTSKAFIPFAKRLGFLGSDGVPTELYNQFRNPSTSKRAMGEAIRRGYADLYSRNEYLHDLSDAELRGLIVEATGLEKDSPTVRAIAKSFQQLAQLAEFEELIESDAEVIDVTPSGMMHVNGMASKPDVSPIGVGLSYTINLNLPETTDIAVFNAIFRSLRDNLLQRS